MNAAKYYCKHFIKLIFCSVFCAFAICFVIFFLKKIGQYNSKWMNKIIHCQCSWTGYELQTRMQGIKVLLLWGKYGVLAVQDM